MKESLEKLNELSFRELIREKLITPALGPITEISSAPKFLDFTSLMNFLDEDRMDRMI